MSNLADLRVGLLLNDASFRSNISNAMNHAGRETKRFSDKAKRDAKGVEDSFNGISKSVTNVAGKLALLAGGGLSIGSILSVSRQYGQALSDLSAITGASAEQMKRYDDAARSMGRTTEFGATKVADAMKLLASAKPALLNTAGALEEVTAKSITLAQASGVDLADAAKSLSLSLNQYGASALSAERYINVLAAGAKYGASEISETSEAVKNSGTVAAQAGIKFEELNAAIQVLADKGIKGAEAGRMLRNVILVLERSADKSLRPSVVGLGAALDNLDKKNYSTTASVKLFGRANVSAAVNLRENTDKLKELTVALTGTSTAYDQANDRAQNLSSDLDLLGRAFEGLALSVGHSANGPMRSGIQNVTAAVNGLTDNFSTLASIVTYAVLPVMASRMTMGLQTQAKTWYQTGAAAREAARQTRNSAQATIESAKASRLHAQQESQRLAQQSVINKQHGMNISYQREYAVLRRQIREADIAEAAAKEKLIAANNRLALSTRALSVAGAGARGALNLLGGPMGAALLAGSALYGLYNHSVQAREGLRSLKDETVLTVAELQKLSKVKVQLKLDEWEEDVVKLQAEKKQLEGQLERYSDTAINIAKSREKGAFGSLFWDSKGMEKEKNVVLGKLEDTVASLELRINQINEGKKTVSIGQFEVKPKEETPKEEPVVSTGTNELPGTITGKKELNQYQQLRRQIESEHATSLQKITLNESDTLDKLKELHHSGGMSQTEMNRLSLISAENYQRQRVTLAEKYSPSAEMIRQEREATQELKELFDSRLLTESEYQRARLQLTQTSQRDRLSQQAKDLALPNISLAGEVDPVVQLRNQLEEQKALYQAYYRDGVINKERYEALVAQASEKSKEAQIQAVKELYSAQGNWQRMQINLIDAVEQKTAGSLAGMLTGTKGFSEGLRELSASLAESIIQDLIKIAIQGQITNAITGLFGGFGGGTANGSTVPMPPKNISVMPHAKGGVHNSPGLSQYSNQVVSSPTLFAFAKGGAPNAGLMGEAGPEAIMPLKRGPDGNLGVRMYGGNGDTAAPVVHIHIDGEGNQQVQASGGYEQFGREVGQFVDQRFRKLMDKETRPSGSVWNLVKGGR
ncbi:TPA: phage tail tape measure protein [Morganella morganii]|nr:phage tail tape measure protein [Morganella morganii]HDF2362799.1 phage tail tape measure protein [Morganella morganii]HDF2422025.1 phage tail tape measure protein [Morganella morganii]